MTDRVASDDSFENKSKYVGKVDAKEQLKEMTEDLMSSQVHSSLSMMVNTVIF